MIQCSPGSGRGSIYGMSNPKALGPTTFIASGVLSIGLAGSTTTPTLMPYRIASVVIGSPNRGNINHFMHASIVKLGGRGFAYNGSQSLHSY